MPFSSLSSPVSNLSLSSTTQSSSAPIPISSVGNNSKVTQYLYTETVTASSSSASNAPTTGGKSSKPAAGMIVSTADFTSGQALPTGLVMATSYTNSSAVPTSTYTSWDASKGSSTMAVGGTAVSSPQDRPSHAVRASVRSKASSLALGVLVLALVLMA